MPPAPGTTPDLHVAWARAYAGRGAANTLHEARATQRAARRAVALLQLTGVRSDLVALQIKPDGGDVRAGTAIQLNLFAVTSGGKTDLIPGNAASWSCAPEGAAEVNRQGRLTPRRPGTVTVTATYAGQTARSVFTVAA
jgi:hypothetical protein